MHSLYVYIMENTSKMDDLGEALFESKPPYGDIS